MPLNKEINQINQNKTRSWDGRLKATTRAEVNFIRVTSLHDRRLTAPNITAQLNKHCEKKSTVRIRLCEASLYGRIGVKKPLFTKHNNVKRLKWSKAHKYWTIEE